MRTTVTINSEIARRLKELAHRRQTSFTEVLNEVLQRGLGGQSIEEPLPPFVVEPHDSPFLPGIDLGKLNQLADELEVEDFLNEATGKT